VGSSRLSASAVCRLPVTAYDRCGHHDVHQIVAGGLAQAGLVVVDQMVDTGHGGVGKEGKGTRSASPANRVVMVGHHQIQIQSKCYK
jgi:hypothetical protein